MMTPEVPFHQHSYDSYGKVEIFQHTVQLPDLLAPLPKYSRLPLLALLPLPLVCALSTNVMPTSRTNFHTSSDAGVSLSFQCQVPLSPQDHAPQKMRGTSTLPFLPRKVTRDSAVSTSDRGRIAAVPSKDGSMSTLSLR